MRKPLKFSLKHGIASLVNGGTGRDAPRYLVHFLSTAAGQMAVAFRTESNPRPDAALPFTPFHDALSECWGRRTGMKKRRFRRQLVKRAINAC
jgi:hypothetical protein